MKDYTVNMKDGNSIEGTMEDSEAFRLRMAWLRANTGLLRFFFRGAHEFCDTEGTLWLIMGDVRCIMIREHFLSDRGVGSIIGELEAM